MHPLLNFYGVQVSAYLFFIVVALIVVFVGSYWFALKRGFNKNDSLVMLIGMSFSVFIGARVFNLLVNFSWYQEDWSRLFSLKATGLSLYGGALFALGVGALIAYLRKIDLLKFGDSVIPFVGVGIVLMRVGCFLNGCCFGKETGLPWGVKYPAMSPAHLHQISENVFSLTVVAVHPTQIYEMLGALIGIGIAYYFIQGKKADGLAFVAFTMWFSLFRWMNIYLRELNYSETVLDYYYPAFYLIIIASCVFWMRKLSIAGAGGRPALII